MESVSDPAHGTAALANGGLNVTYTPDPDYCNPPPAAGRHVHLHAQRRLDRDGVGQRQVRRRPADGGRRFTGGINEDSGAHLFRVRTNDLNADGGRFSWSR